MALIVYDGNPFYNLDGCASSFGMAFDATNKIAGSL